MISVTSSHPKDSLTANALPVSTNIPSFRLPADVLDDEIDLIVERGVDLKLNTPINSMKELLDEGYDAVFVGTGAPRGKDLDIPGRHDSSRIHIGIDWLESVAFEHTDKIGENVLIIGVGNTAMDCCRSSKNICGGRGRAQRHDFRQASLRYKRRR